MDHKKCMETISRLTLIQNCGICYEGASTECRRNAQQPKPDGTTRLCSRSKGRNPGLTLDFGNMLKA